jgi:hypothetical protein
LTDFLAHASLDSTVKQSAAIDLVFEHWEPPPDNMKILVAPKASQSIKTDAFDDFPPNSHSEHLS